MILRNGVLFNDSWLIRGGTMTSVQIRTKIFQLMSSFHRGIDEGKDSDDFLIVPLQGLTPYLPLAGKKKRSTEITLSQECTKAAHTSIKAYLSVLSNAKSGIRVDCKAQERKLVVPAEKIKEDLKAPIIELARHDRIRLSPDEVASYIDDCTKVVDRFLSAEEFQRHPMIVQFTSLIHNEPIIECGIFYVEMIRVWDVLQERARNVIQKCSRQIRECFHDSVADLQKEFNRFKKILSFRSMEPTTMLKNKVRKQAIQFDPREHEYLINVALLRRALPRHVADHNMFFQRRLHIFTHFVRKRQAAIESNAQNALNRLKILNSFTNPDDVEDYLVEMRVLKPLILTIHQELIELNEQEKIVGLPQLSLHDVQLIGSQVNSLWSLFEWTQRFHEFRRYNLIKQNILLEGHRAAKAFSVQLKSDIEKFRHNIPVLEVMSCPRLGERHWQKMSDIVGFNLAQYENATVAQICELNLNLYVSKLKPIAYIAEREGAISDQANFITEFWAEAFFIMDPTYFWGIQGMESFLLTLKSTSPRLALISNSDVLKLLSMNSAEEGLQIIQRECFPLLRDLYLNDEDHLFGVNLDGERAKFEDLVSIANLKDDGPQIFVTLLEKTIANYIVKDYARFTEHHSTVKTSFRLTRVINDFILHTNQDAGFKHIYELSSRYCKQDADDQFSTNFTHNWTLGKVPLFYGTLNETRSRVQAMCRNLLCTVRFVNCHPSLQENVFDIVIRASQDNIVLFVLENVDQLPNTVYNHMCLCLDRLEVECARLILCTTVHSAAQHLSHHIKVFNSKSARRPESGGGAKVGELNVAAITGQKRRSSSIKVQAPAPSKKLSSPPKAHKPAEDALMELMFSADALNYNLANVNFSIACIGSSAKWVLSECIRRVNARANWIYFDALTYNQVISASNEFGETSHGYLLKCLKEAMIPDERTFSTTPVASAPQTGRASLPTTAGTTNTEESLSRRWSVVYKTPKYIIFYGSKQFLLHFPQISSLFYSVSSGMIPEMPPGSYITMSDGSNFYAAKHIRFVLCLPFASDIEDAISHVTTANYGEILRAVTVYSCVCFILVYLKDDVGLLDKLVEERLANWDRSSTDLGKLPFPISQYRIASWENATWVKWAEQLKVKSLVKKELSMSEIYISFPEIDHVLGYVVRQFLVSEKHFILSGPHFTGKSAAIRRIVEQLENQLQDYKFLWMDCTGRFDLLQMQEKLSVINITNQRATTDQLLPYVVRLAKGLMFAYPDNTPDLDSMKRLWTHEVLRILFDPELNAKFRQQFLNKKDSSSWAIPDFKLENLLYSEMAGFESMDGITYGIITRRNDFIKTLENLHFEYTKNHEGFQINLTITDFTIDHCQRIMRAVRQHNEHLALAGNPGCGRHQCVKLAAFGVVGLVQHVFFDTNTAESFEQSWKIVIIRVINLLTSINQPINQIPNEWLMMLKQWLQRPVIGNLLSDTMVIKMAEKMVESEKALATLVQSSNIRLPGQRYCQFLSFEAFKNVDLLRSTLEARIADFLHAVFFIPVDSLHKFKWCTGDYFDPIGQSESRQMIEKVASECVADNKARIPDAVEQVFNATKDTINRAQFNCLQFYKDTHLLYELKIDHLQKDCAVISDKLLQRNAKIGLVLEGPINEFKSATEKLSSYTPADYAKLGKLKTPSLGVKYTVEAIRSLIEKEFKASKLIDIWKTLIGATKSRLDNLLGNCIMQSGFRSLVAPLEKDAKTTGISKWRTSLLRYNINYDEKFTSVPTLAIEYFRAISWHEPWPLIQTSRPDFANALKFFYNDCPMLDMSQLKWTDREVVDRLLRTSYSDSALVISNVQNSPPAVWYEVLQREPEKEKRTVDFMNRALLMGENLKLVFVTDRELSAFDPAFIRMVVPMRLNEPFEFKETQLLDTVMTVEEDLLKMLTEFSAIDILESEDLSNSIVGLTESIPINS
ncbi:hypothetical protein M3Y96_00793900 [Aphelenchoides besseyi]|nr:hypothetical protein M3Y96_00793900 [Aphelenchoides besseyi]